VRAWLYRLIRKALSLKSLNKFLVLQSSPLGPHPLRAPRMYIVERRGDLERSFTNISEAALGTLALREITIPQDSQHDEYKQLQSYANDATYRC